MKELGGTAMVGEAGFTTNERNWYRPTLDITGIWSGYTAPEGFLGIILGLDHCRLMCRLVEGQTPKNIQALIKKHIASHTPKGATITYQELSDFAEGITMPSDTKAFTAAFTSLREIYGKAPLLLGAGNSNATLAILKEELGLPPYSFGFVQPDENFHSDNEFMRVSDIEKGQKAFCVLLQYIGQQK